MGAGRTSRARSQCGLGSPHRRGVPARAHSAKDSATLKCTAIAFFSNVIFNRKLNVSSWHSFKEGDYHYYYYLFLLLCCLVTPWWLRRYCEMN